MQADTANTTLPGSATGGAAETARDGAALGRALARRIGAGDRDAENELVLRYRASLVRMLRKRGRTHDAEDLADEALMNLLVRLRGEGLADPARLSAYLHGIAVNMTIADYRKQARRQTRADSDAVDEQTSSEPSPQKLADRDEMAGMVRDLLPALTVERDTEILRRVYVLGHDKPTVCRILNLEPANYNRVLHRARRRFRDLVEERTPEYAALE